MQGHRASLSRRWGCRVSQAAGNVSWCLRVWREGHLRGIVRVIMGQREWSMLYLGKMIVRVPNRRPVAEER